MVLVRFLLTQRKSAVVVGRTDSEWVACAMLVSWRVATEANIRRGGWRARACTVSVWQMSGHLGNWGQKHHFSPPPPPTSLISCTATEVSAARIAPPFFSDDDRKKHPSKSIRSFSPNRGQFPVCPTRARARPQSERASASVIAPLWLNGARAVTRRVQIFMPFPPFPSSPTLTAVDQTTQDTNLASPPH